MKIRKLLSKIFIYVVLISLIAQPLSVFSITEEIDNKETDVEKVETKSDEIENTSNETEINTIESDEPEKKTDILYTTHVERIGWQKYTQNGGMAGTTGKALRLEGIKIKLDNQEYDGDVEYKTHIESIGWEKTYKKNDEMSGTSGRALRLEGIKIKLTNQQYNGDIEYRTLIQNVGWQQNVKNGEMSGTSGRALRLEAIRINLTEEMAEHYDIYYRVHAEKFGWLDWAKNGQSAGTSGYGYRLEAIEIKLIEKGSETPTNTTKPYVDRKVKYSGYYEGNWKNSVYDGEVIGNNSNLQSFRVELLDKEFSGNISYSTYVTNYGWTNYVNKNAISNNVNNKIEALKIKLDGEIADHYIIYYSAYISNIGWTDWAKNDEECGNVGYGKNIQKIKIKLVGKEEASPGNTTNKYQEDELKVSYNSYIQGKTWQGYVKKEVLNIALMLQI